MLSHYSRAKPPNLRRLDSKKKYPQDIDHEVHDDGEIWAAALAKFARDWPKDRDKFMIAHHFLVNRRASFADAANALITARQEPERWRERSRNSRRF